MIICGVAVGPAGATVAGAAVGVDPQALRIMDAATIKDTSNIRVFITILLLIDFYGSYRYKTRTMVLERTATTGLFSFLSRAPPLKLSRLCSFTGELLAFTDYTSANRGKMIAGTLSIQIHKTAIGSGGISPGKRLSKID
jgi:hypothetical protein